MRKQWSLGVLSALVLLLWPATSQAQSDAVQLWNFSTRGDTGDFQSAAANGASNQVSWVDKPSSEGSGALKIDYTGSKGFNTAVSTGIVPPAPYNTATISAQVYVPAQITMDRLELGLQVDGAPANKDDVVFHSLDVRGGWNFVAWAVHPGQLAGGQHRLGFALDTDDPMPAPLYIDDVRAIQPHIFIDATQAAPFDPVMTWGNNVAYYYPPSFFQDPAPLQLAQDAGYYFFRIPGGLNSDVYHWNGNGVRKPDGSINPAARRPDGTWSIDYSGYAPGFEVRGETSTGDPLFTSQPDFSKLNVYDHTPPVDAAALANWIMGLGPQAQIMVDVNVGTGSPLVATGPNNSLQESDVAAGAQEAAGWVRYYNQQKGLHVKYWEVGNELNPYGAEIGVHIRDSSPQGWHWITANDYATIFRTYAKAMKAVDPAVKIAGPVGYLSAFGDATGQTSWIKTFIKQAGDVVDAIDIHFYNHGESEAQTMAKPAELQPEVDKMRGWIRQSFPQRVDQIAFGVSEWGDYNNTYAIGDGLYAADLMGQMAQTGLAFGNVWDIGNIIPDNGRPLPAFGFDSIGHQAGGWTAQPSNGSNNALSWTDDPHYARPGHWSLIVDYKGSIGPNASLGHGLAGVRVNPAANSLAVDTFIPSYPGNNTITFWLRIERADGSFDDSGRDQPQQPIWGQWNRVLLPLDPAKLAGARRVDVVVDSNLPIVSPLYFGNLDLQQSSRQPNGRYWAAYMYHHYFANTLVGIDLGGASRDSLAAYASRAADGSLYLMVVNKDPLSDIGMPITINGYKAAGAAEVHTWSGDNYAWDPGTGRAAKDAPPSGKTIPAGSSFSYVFPKYSITAIKLTPG
jgi:hypothetical protein